MIRAMEAPSPGVPHDNRLLVLKAVLLALWAIAGFGVCFFARDLQFTIGAWPFSYWWAAQGAVLFFIAIVVFYAWLANRLRPDDALQAGDGAPGE